MKNNICPICNLKFERLMAHVYQKHKEMYKEQCEIALKMYEMGMTLREIGNSNLTYWSFGKALGDLIRSNKTKEQLKEERIKRIKTKLLVGYEQKIYKKGKRGRKRTKNHITSSIDAGPLDILEWNEKKLTKKYLNSINDKTINLIKKDLLSYLLKSNVCESKYSSDELYSEFNNLILNKTVNIENKIIGNISSLGNKIYKHFFPNIYKMHGKNKKSVYDIVNDPVFLEKVIDNRFDKNIQKLFSGNITKNMIIQGAKASGLAFRGSQFKPLTAKAIYKYFVKNGDNVLDYSAGFGSRLLGLGATEIKAKYYAYEPNTETYKNLLKMIDFFQFNAEIKNCGSEEDIFDNIKFNFVFSSPPYFNAEIYSNEITQCYNKYPKYTNWLKEYWEKTVINIKKMIAENGIFGINAGNRNNKFMIKIERDMNNIILKNGFILIDKWNMETKSLYNKTPKLEPIYFYRKS